MSLYAITRSLQCAIVAFTMTAHSPSFMLFVDLVLRNYSDLVHATGLLPLQCIAFRLLMSCFVLFLYCRRSTAFGTDLSCVRAVTKTWWQWLLPALSFSCSFLSSVSTGSHVGPWGGSTFNGISQVVWSIRPVFPPSLKATTNSRRCSQGMLGSTLWAACFRGVLCCTMVFIWCHSSLCEGNSYFTFPQWSYH